MTGTAHCLLVARTPLRHSEANDLLLRIKLQRRPQEAHIVLFKDRGQNLWIGWTIARKRPKFLVELMAAAGRVHHDDLAWLVGDIQESVGNLRREVGKAAFVAVEQGLTNPNLEPSFDHMDRLLLSVVDMQGRTSMRRDPDHKVIEGSIRVVTCHLEDEIP